MKLNISFLIKFYSQSLSIISARQPQSIKVPPPYLIADINKIFAKSNLRIIKNEISKLDPIDQQDMVESVILLTESERRGKGEGGLGGSEWEEKARMSM